MVVTELPDEVLVYDTQRHEAHLLYRAAVIVWRSCDGRTTVEQAREQLSSAGFGDGANLVDDILSELHRAHLLQPGRISEDILVRSRRRALKTLAIVGGTALALPLVQSLVAPTSAQACTSFSAGRQDPCNEEQCCTPPLLCQNGACCGPSSFPCGGDGDCCSGTCAPGTPSTCQ